MQTNKEHTLIFSLARFYRGLNTFLGVIIMLYQDYFDKYLKFLSFRNFTPHSVSSYCTYVRPYLEYLEQVLQKRPEEASWDDYRDFIMFIQSERDLNDRTVNTMITHLSLFHSTVLDKEWNKKQIPFRKFDEYVPYIPSHERITFFINSIQDLKVKAMVSLMYSSGMRVSEVCSLKCGDIYRSQGYILVRTSKSRIPRQAICSQNAMAIVIEYWKSLPLPRPGKDNYLFPKQSGKDAPIDTFFPLRRMTDQEKLLGWDHLITCHTLRRACAIHLYENKYQLEDIRKVLGHSNVNTTRLYLRPVINSPKGIRSPFDQESSAEKEAPSCRN